MTHPRQKTAAELQAEAENREIGRRIGLAAARRRIPVTKLDELTGQSKGQTSRLIKGRPRGPGHHILERYVSALQVSRAWLLRGEGDMDAVDKGTDSTLLSTLLGRSVERDNIDRANEYHENAFSRQAVDAARAQAKAEGIAVDSKPPDYWAIVLLRVQHEQTAALKEAIRTRKPIGLPEPEKRRKAKGA